MNYPAMKVSELRQLVRKQHIASGLAVAGARKDVLLQALASGRWPQEVQCDTRPAIDLVSAYYETLTLAKRGDESERFYFLQGRIASALAGIEGVI